MDYAEFLASKAIVDPMTGIDRAVALSDDMFPHQQDITRWALRRGRAALFAGTGLGNAAVEMGRKGVGAELKPSYFAQAVRNLEGVGTVNPTLFDEPTAAVSAQEEKA